MVIRNSACAFILYIIICGISFAQNNIRFEHISIEHGLSHSSVQCIIQDKSGFLWIATEDGLNRYDGNNFKIYRPQKGNPNSISDIFIWEMTEDSNGDIWIATNMGGLDKYNVDTEKFTHYRNNPGDKNSLSSDKLRSVFIDRSGRLWVGTWGGGLNVLDTESGKFTKYLHDAQDSTSLNNNVVNNIFEDSSGRIWICTDGGLAEYNKKQNNFKRYVHKASDQYSINNNRVTAITQDDQGRLWVGTNDGIAEFDNKSGKFYRMYYEEKNPNSLSNNLVTAMYKDDSGTIWIATDAGGVSSYDPVKRLFNRYMHDPANPRSLSINIVRKIFQDDLGMLWIGTNGGGLNRVFRGKKKFELVTYDSYNIDGLNHTVVRSFYEDSRDYLWVGTAGGGINILDKQTKKYAHMKNQPNVENSLTSNIILSIAEDPEGDFWAGTWEAGLNRITVKSEIKSAQDYAESKIKRYTHNPQNPYSISSDIVQKVFLDKFGNLWFGTGSGIDLYEKETDRFYNLSSDSLNKFSLSDNRVQSAIIQDRNGCLWIGTWGGLNRMKCPGKKLNPSSDPSALKNIKFFSYKHDPVVANSLSDDRVITLYEDPLADDLTIWIGTYGGGLNKMVIKKDNKSDKEIILFNNYTESDGLSSNVVYGIQGDSQGNIWLSTNNGISKFEVSKNRFKNYNESEGVQSNQFYWGASYMGRDGKIYFGGVNGYNAFYPENVVSSSKLPGVAITDFRIFNQSVEPGETYEGRVILEKNITKTKEISISYKDYVISFEFASLHFIAPQKNEYAYMMEGFETKWNYVGNRRFVTYANLPPGEYTFRVKASNNEGIWNEEGASIKLIVTPPYWETSWFRIAALIVMAGLMYAVYRIRIRTIRNQNRRLELKVRKRTTDLRKEITERKKIEAELRNSEEKLKELNANKDRFFSIIAHDIKSPFSALIGFARLLETDLKQSSPEEIEEGVNAISKSAKSIYDLLENLLEWSRLQIGHTKYSPVIFDIYKTTEDVIELLKPSANNKDISIENGLDAGTLVLADSYMISTVLRNLISNAVKFTKPGGNIRVNSIKYNGKLEVQVIDTGVGISEEDIQRLFRIEIAQSKIGTSKERGTGLGLILCKELVEKCGGELRVESELEKGSVFIFTLNTAETV